MPGQTQQHDKLTLLLADLFQKESSEAIENLSSQLLQTVQSAGVDSRTEAERSASEARWDGGSSVLITYADSLVRRDEAGLLTLSTVINAHYGALASVVHVLPFLRASSDGGFAVASHEELEPRLGDWAYLELLSRGRTLMADLVLNHVSASHPWVQQFIRGEEPGLSCIYAPDPSGDWSAVIRPRSSSLFTTLATITTSMLSITITMTMAVTTATTGAMDSDGEILVVILVHTSYLHTSSFLTTNKVNMFFHILDPEDYAITVYDKQFYLLI